MKRYDWIVVGSGIAGAALSYELVKKGFVVLLIEKDTVWRNATRFSYGGLAFWSGTTDLTRQLCQEGIERHRILSEELDAETQFRELDLLLTISADENPQQVVADYTRFALPPRLLSGEEACELEPLLNRSAISGALTGRHGHISPEGTAQGYCQAFSRLGGTIEIGEVIDFVREGNRVTGVHTMNEFYTASNIVICAGGFSRKLLKSVGIPVRVYFTHAEMLETPPTEVKLRTLVMPAVLKRFSLESVSSRVEVNHLWDELDQELASPILDAGAVQFKNGSLRIGQISRTLSDPNQRINPQESEAEIRAGVGKILPALEYLPGIWHECLVAFSADQLPLVGAISELEGIYLFSGFSNPLVIIPPLAKRFADWVAGQSDNLIEQLSPDRFQEP